MITLTHDGLVMDSRVHIRIMPAIEHGPLLHVDAIVLHQTDTSTGQQTLNAYGAQGSGNGAHFLVDENGTIFQTAHLNKKCQHVGALLSRCMAEHNCVAVEQDFYNDLIKQHPWGHLNAIETHHHEMKKPYPKRYPDNEDSIGIEVAGKFLGQPGDDTGPWDEPNAQQQAATHWLVPALLGTLKLRPTDVYRHPQVSRKREGEARGVRW